MSAARRWEQATLDQEQRLQAALFPAGLAFDGSGFGTAVTCLAFPQLPVAAVAWEGLASPSFKTSNRLVGWIREMGLLRHAIGCAA